METSLSEVLAADPGAAGVIAGAIALQAVLASHIVDSVKALVRQVVPDWSPQPWMASVACAVISVLLAIRTLGPTSYPWDAWVLGLVIATATGALYHDARQASKTTVKANKNGGSSDV